MVKVSIRQALNHVAKHPDPATDVSLDVPCWELVSRSLFEIANNPNTKVRGSMARAVRAQKIIANRQVGLRRPGTHPVARVSEDIDFHDLTQAELT